MHIESMKKPMKYRREFALLFESSKLQQTQLAGFLGVSKVTVNRWLVERDDAVDPPWYALQFLRLYMMLPEALRGRVMVQNENKQ
ncbi:helix-turn-helix domain-containing protein [Klebsiella pneumoniae]